MKKTVSYASIFDFNNLKKYWQAFSIFYLVIILLYLLPIGVVIPALIVSISAYYYLPEPMIIESIVGFALLGYYLYFGLQKWIFKPKYFTLNRGSISSLKFNLLKIRILNLDHSITEQKKLLQNHPIEMINLENCGPKVRLLCPFSTFRKLELELVNKLKGSWDESPYITFLGSNDFDHVTLLLLRRIPTAFNLLFFDQHADWNPFFFTDMMCGSWLYHAFTASQMDMVFHIGGGEKAFDATGNIFDAVECFGNGQGIQKYIDNGRIVCLPASRTFAKNPYINYDKAVNQPVKTSWTVLRQRVEFLLEKYHDKLTSKPLFIAIDKDVLIPQDNVQVWDSGELSVEDVETIISTFVQLSNYQIAGVSICGDYSPPNYQSFFQLASLLEKAAILQGTRLEVHPYSLEINEKTNERLLSLFLSFYS
ncbi:hypothetical protein [Gloeothece verrucosa]|uniref:Arginase/agmatinase/formiminoglutamase n=1 Tax=Gloeothece verrucosa (strain PCC 7822) TaxID=497965 RepID=E0U778_GLOV7|nr:hypothetical protein [Gloeothece verrucosa]ADN12465.1 hypothetical protein Cyan7822_0420 [Gloeothece verrucosa PCC 7822]